jgi:hypothetical protein
MPLAFSKKTFWVFNTFIQSLPSAWSLPGTLEGAKIITLMIPGKDPKFMSDQPPAQYRQII